MSRILMYKQIRDDIGIDFINSTDYSKIYEKSGVLGVGTNIGNKLWYQGLYSEIDTAENEITIRTNETADEINENFDLVVYPMANFFALNYCSDTSHLVEQIRKIKIPVYIIACGIQSNNYDELDSLVKKIKTPASKFIEAVYKTGGEFALRGYYTKEFFNLLGYKSAVVTGCPSLFQLGRDFTAAVTDGDIDFIKPIINGKIFSFEKIMTANKSSVYFSQELFWDMLYNSKFDKKTNLKKDISFFHYYGIMVAELISSERIKMIADMNDWYHYIRNNGFNYSFGTKIHGSIMPILAGIPATVLTIDSRTKEMTEFFDIPSVEYKKKYKYTYEDFLGIYSQCDYSKFNRTYKEKFDAYERFLIEHNIVKKINEDNKFFNKPGKTEFDSFQPNREFFCNYADKLKKESIILKTAEKIIYR